MFRWFNASSKTTITAESRDALGEKTYLKNVLSALDAIDLDTLVDNATDKGDWFITWARLLQVFTDAAAYGTNANGPGNGNPNSTFNQWTWNSDGSLTFFGWGCEVLPFAGLAVGVGVHWYRIVHEKNLYKYEYVKKTTRALNPEKKIEVDYIQTSFAKLLSKKDFTSSLGEEYGGVEIDSSDSVHIGFKRKTMPATSLDDESASSSRSSSEDEISSSGSESADDDFKASDKGKEKETEQREDTDDENVSLEEWRRELQALKLSCDSDGKLSRQKTQARITIKLAQDEEKLEEQFKPNAFIQWIRYSRVGKWLMPAWLHGYYLSMLFWVPWWALVTLVGLGAINTITLPFAAIALIPVGGYLALKAGGLIFNWLKEKFSTPAAADPNAKITDADLTKALALKLKTLFAIREHHAAKRKLFAAALGVNEDVIKQKHHARKIAKLKKYQDAKAEKESEDGEEEIIYFADTRVGQLILDTKNAKRRAWLNTIKNFLDGLVITFFIVWLCATVIGAPLAIPLLPAALSGVLAPVTTFLNGLGGLFFATGWGSLNGLLLAFNAYTKEKEVQNKLHADLLKKFQEPFTGFHRANSDLAKLTKQGDYQMTKLEKWLELEHSIAKKKEKILQLRNELSELEKKFVANFITEWEPTNEGQRDQEAKKVFAALVSDAVRKIVFDYNLDEVDPYNDYFFEKQKYTVPIFSRIKQGLNYAFHFFGGGQSGVFIARQYFLGSMTAASVALPAVLVVGGTGLVVALAATGYGLPIVIGVAVAFALTYGAIRLGFVLYERRRRHNQLRAETVDERLSHMNKGERELADTVTLLKEKIGEVKNNLQPKPDQSDTVAPSIEQEAQPLPPPASPKNGADAAASNSAAPPKTSSMGLFSSKQPATAAKNKKTPNHHHHKWWRARAEGKQDKLASTRDKKY